LILGRCRVVFKTGKVGTAKPDWSSGASGAVGEEQLGGGLSLGWVEEREGMAPPNDCVSTNVDMSK
jgi:hypothetical protein